MSGRESSDEYYVLGLCDEVLAARGLRQHRFDWLVGDPSPTTGRAVRLPVDSYWPDLNLVVEYRESQHYEATPFFDKPDRLTVSGVHRGEQRRKYDELRNTEIPNHGLQLVVLRTDEFATRGRKIARSGEDIEIVRRCLDVRRIQAAK